MATRCRNAAGPAADPAAGLQEPGAAWTLEAVERLLSAIPPRARGAATNQMHGWTLREPGSTPRPTDWVLPVYDAAVMHRVRVTDGRFVPPDTPVEARDALRRLEKAMLALGPLAEYCLRGNLRSINGVRLFDPTGLMLDVIRAAIADASALIRSGPRSDDPHPYDMASRPTRLARELARAYHALNGRLPLTTHPRQRTSGEHPYHGLVRQAFDCAGFRGHVSWERHAQEAALWLRRFLGASRNYAQKNAIMT